jgi:hypothetical protein
VATLGFVQAELEVKIHLTILPLFKELVVNVDPVAPTTFTLFICHWKVGLVPTFTGFARKLTVSPAQMVVLEELMVTDAADELLTLKVVS